MVNIVKVPLQVSCTHLSRVKLGEAMVVKFSVKNISDEVLVVWVGMGAEIDLKDKEAQSFLMAGESMSQVNLMPFVDEYTFTYTFVPMKLGMLDLPNFSVSKLKPERGKLPQSDD